MTNAAFARRAQKAANLAIHCDVEEKDEEALETRENGEKIAENDASVEKRESGENPRETEYLSDSDRDFELVRQT